MNTSKHLCPDCGSECKTWTVTGRNHYIECKNPNCRRYMITLEVNTWLKLTTTEIETYHVSSTGK